MEACREIMESLPDTRVLMLTASTGGERRDRGGGRRSGRLSSEGGRDGPGLGMMKSAAAGEGRLPTEVVRRVFDRMRSGARSKDVNLTQREKEILVSFCRGMSYVAIAAARESRWSPSETPSTPFR